MGVGVSGWRLARAVAVAGQLGVVSGVALDTLIARRLQLGDPGGHIRRALANFPYPDVSEQILDRYFVEGGIGPEEPFRLVPRPSLHPSRWATDLVIAANFVEVFLAKEGHDGLVGVNYLEKLQMSTPAATYGAMLAGVDYVLVGAGIPAEFPGLLDALAGGRAGEVSVDVLGGGAARFTVAVRPEPICRCERGAAAPQVSRHRRLARAGLLSRPRRPHAPGRVRGRRACGRRPQCPTPGSAHLGRGGTAGLRTS